MYCKSCGTLCENDQNYCHVDGVSLKNPMNIFLETEAKPFCKNCGNQISSLDIYCNNCGKSKHKISFDSKISNYISDVKLDSLKSIQLPEIDQLKIDKNLISSSIFKIQAIYLAMAAGLTFIFSLFASFYIQEKVSMSLFGILSEVVYYSGYETVKKIWSPFSIFSIAHGVPNMFRAYDYSMTASIKISILLLIPLISMFITHFKMEKSLILQQLDYKRNIPVIFINSIIYGLIVLGISRFSSLSISDGYDTIIMNFRYTAVFYGMTFYLVGRLISYTFASAFHGKNPYSRVAISAIVYSFAGILIAGLWALNNLKNNLRYLNLLSSFWGGFSVISRYLSDFGNLFMYNMGEYIFKLVHFVPLVVREDYLTPEHYKMSDLSPLSFSFLIFFFFSIHTIIGALIKIKNRDVDKIKATIIYSLVFGSMSFITSFGNRIYIKSKTPDVFLDTTGIINTGYFQSFFLMGIIGGALFGVGILIVEFIKNQQEA